MTITPCRRSFAVATLTAFLTVTSVVAHAANDDRYPNISGQWSRADSAQWDPSKPGGLKQQAPLTPEYQAILEGNITALARGDERYNQHAYCIPAGMPRMMIAYEPLEVIGTPETTYIRDYLNEFRRIFTDGRQWPVRIRPSYSGYSVGTWVDEDGDGRYDVLIVETRSFKGPRLFDATGIPLHKDNETIIKERIYLDKSNPDILHDDITTIDHALTSHWTVKRSYRREQPAIWPAYLCAEDNHHVTIGEESYFRSADGFLMPTRKNQSPPDLRFFNQPGN
jgi:hypothetical protein